VAVGELRLAIILVFPGDTPYAFGTRGFGQELQHSSAWWPGVVQIGPVQRHCRSDMPFSVISAWTKGLVWDLARVSTVLQVGN
jgi:hypothetical protein